MSTTDEPMLAFADNLIGPPEEYWVSEFKKRHSRPATSSDEHSRATR